MDRRTPVLSAGATVGGSAAAGSLIISGAGVGSGTGSSGSGVVGSTRTSGVCAGSSLSPVTRSSGSGSGAVVGDSVGVSSSDSSIKVLIDYRLRVPLTLL